MEYNTDGMVPKQPNIFKRAWQNITLPHYGRTIGFLALLVITLSVPATIAFLSQRTTTKNQAATNGEVAFVDANGTQLPTTVNDPNVYLKILKPDGWDFPSQGAIQKSSQIASLIKKAYAATFCTSPAVCSTTTGVPADQWTPTGDTCMLNNDGDEFPGACYIRNTGGGSSPTATPTSESVQCLQMQMVGRDGTNFQQGDILIAKPLFSGRPQTVKVWVSGNGNVTNPVAGTIGDWTKVAELNSSPDSGVTYTFDNPGQFDVGRHIVMAELKDAQGNVLDDGKIHPNTCAKTFEILASGGGGSTPTPTQTQTATKNASCAGTPEFYESGVKTDHVVVDHTYEAKITMSNNGSASWNRPFVQLMFPLPGDFRVTSLVNTVGDWDIPSRRLDLGSASISSGNWYTFVTPITPKRTGNLKFIWQMFDVDSGEWFGGACESGINVNPSTGGGKIIARINIENVDDQAGGTSPQALTTLAQFNTALSGKYAWKLNNLNQNETTATRIVNVGFTATDGTNVTVQARITLAGTPPPAASPTPAFGCSFSPQEMGTGAPVDNIPNDLFRWVEVNKATGDPVISCETGNFDSSLCTVRDPDNPNTSNAEKNADCPQREGDPFVAKDTSNWCTGNGINTVGKSAHCFQLRYIGPSTGAPTNTPVPGQPTATAIPGVPTATPRPTVTPGGPTVTPTATPRPTVTPGGPTVTPTATPIPTPTSSVTPPPPGPASVTFKVTLAGIGVKTSKGSQAINNDNPNQKQRDATLYLYEPGVDATGDFSGARAVKKIAQPEAIIYDNDGKFVAANFNLGATFTAGQYQVFILTPGYLRKRIPNIQTLNVGTNTINQVVTLTLGDANNDNLLNLLDYREYLSCLNKQTTTCLKADFNDDGYIDNDDKHNGKEGNNKPSFLDHNLFTDQFALISGD